MANRKIESMSLAKVRNLAKRQGPELKQGDGWQVGDVDPLGNDFRVIADDILTWFTDNQNWSLRAVELMFFNHEPSERQFGEITQIEPDQLIAFFKFSAEKPPRTFFGSRLYLGGAFNYENYPGRRIVTERSPSIPKNTVELRAEQFGPLRKLDSAVLNADCPYYLLGSGVRVQPSIYPLPRKAELEALQGQATELTAIVEAADLIDQVRKDQNRLGRIKYDLNKKFPRFS